MKNDDTEVKVFRCGSDEPQMIYWSGPCDPNEFPKMKVAWWATIKWRLSKWWYGSR